MISRTETKQGMRLDFRRRTLRERVEAWRRKCGHRLSLMYAREGVVLARSTMCGWHEHLADLAERLVEAMLLDAFTPPYLCADATAVLVRAES